MKLRSAKWFEHQFTSSSVKTPEFKAFANAFRADIRALCPGWTPVNFNTGHFYVSGFLERFGKYVYFSASDVRYYPREWYNHVLIRTAKGPGDYTGGPNNYTSLPNIERAIARLHP